MRTIEKNYTIAAPIEKVWDALVNPETIEKWGGGPAKMSDTENFNFSLWGGDIFGKNTMILDYELLEQDWYSGDWPKPSKATFTLSPEGDGTSLTLIHEEVPDEQADEIDDGWDTHYLVPIKDLLEHG